MQHQHFFSNLSYFALSSLDEDGRPWASIVAGGKGFMRALDGKHLAFISDLQCGDPLPHNLTLGLIVKSPPLENNMEQARPVAGLGIDFSNRKRTKVAGFVPDGFAKIDGDSLKVIVFTNRSLGNCPKYITIRTIEYRKRCNSFIEINQPNGTNLTEACKTIISKSDIIFIASRHIQDEDRSMITMGCNIRGGLPGFVRYSENGDSLFLPDYSGNNLYQSLGNIESEGLAGIVFTNFSTGDALYVTGIAKNVFGNEARSIMPRVNCLTQLKITGFRLVRGGINLESIGEPQFSPYDPPLRYLKWELDAGIGKIMGDVESHPVNLVDSTAVCRDIVKFNFKLHEKGVDILPGQYAILDFASVKPGYSHMADENPQQLNDDYLRCWTVTGCYLDISKTENFEVTVKNLPRGAVSSKLHMWHRQGIVEMGHLEFGFKGISGDFTPFKDKNTLKSRHEKMLFIGAGIGATPFISIIKGLDAISSDADTVVLFSSKGQDADLSLQLSRKDGKSELLHFQTCGIYTAKKSNNMATIQNRRIEKSDLQEITDLQKRQVYICGPESFIKDVYQWLNDLEISPENVHSEHFNY